MEEKQGDPEGCGSQGEKETESETENERQRGTQRDGQREAGKEEDNRRGRLPRSRTSRAAGGVKAPAPRCPRPPAAGGRKLPGGKSEPPLRRVSARRGRWPAPPAPRVAEKAQRKWADSGTKFRASRLPVHPPDPQRRQTAIGELGEPPRPVCPRPCPGTGPERGAPLPDTRCRTLRSPPGHSGRSEGTRPPAITRERGGARESETCDRSPGSREEGTAVHARNSASDPAGQAPATCAECRARRACAHLEPTPVPERRAQPGSRRCLSSRFPASRASWLRSRPAPDRRPHSAAAGERTP